MSLRNICIVYRKELTEALRDRRTLVSSILIPLFLFPLLTFGIGSAFVEIAGEATREPSKIMILGGEDSPGVVQQLRAAKNLCVVPRSADFVGLISDKKIRAAVEIPPGFEAAVARGERPEVKIYIFKDDLKSMLSATRVEKLFTDFRDDMVRRRIRSENLPDNLMKPFDVEQQNVVSDEKVAG